MSEKISIICPRCDHEEIFRSGADDDSDPLLIFDDYDELVRCIGDKTVARRAYMLKLQRGPSKPHLNGYGWRIYHCPRCYRLYNRFFFCLKGPDLVYEPDYLCEYCRSLLEVFRPNSTLEIIDENEGYFPKANEPIYEAGDSLWRCSNCKALNSDENSELDIIISAPEKLTLSSGLDVRR